MSDQNEHLASCGHPANEDGECGCSWWPERAPAGSREIDSDQTAPAQPSGLPQSELGGLHPELLARITTAKAALGDFRREEDAYLGGAVTPIYVSHALRLEAELRALIAIIERHPS